MRRAGLILFDIDGTLTRSHNVYIPFNEAFLRTFGFAGDIRTVIPDGNTDPLIVEELFAKAGLPPEIGDAATGRFAANLRDSYTRAIEKGRMFVRALPGVADLVRSLAEIPGLHQGVVTGNLEVTARIKLGAARLGAYLPLGAYGSDAPHRSDLPRIAKTRWEEHAGIRLDPSCCVIAGDTPKDLAAARANGMRCLLVATGRYPEEALRACAPEACLPDFRDTAGTLETFRSLLGFSSR